MSDALHRNGSRGTSTRVTTVAVARAEYPRVSLGGTMASRLDRTALADVDEVEARGFATLRSRRGACTPRAECRARAGRDPLRRVPRSSGPTRDAHVLPAKSNTDRVAVLQRGSPAARSRHAFAALFDEQWSELIWPEVSRGTRPRERVAGTDAQAVARAGLARPRQP